LTVVLVLAAPSTSVASSARSVAASDVSDLAKCFKKKGLDVVTRQKSLPLQLSVGGADFLKAVQTDLPSGNSAQIFPTSSDAKARRVRKAAISLNVIKEQVITSGRFAIVFLSSAPTKRDKKAVKACLD
jgi:hypothetical protein